MTLEAEIASGSKVVARVTRIIKHIGGVAANSQTVRPCMLFVDGSSCKLIASVLPAFSSYQTKLDLRQPFSHMKELC